MVSSLTSGLSTLIWGSNTQNANTVGNAGNAQLLTEELKKSDIVKEGFLYKQSRYMKTWKSRYFVLTKTHLMTFANSNDLRNPTEVIDMNQCSTVKSADEESGKSNSFKLEIAGMTFYMYADTYTEKESWIGALGKAMIKKSVMLDDDFDHEYM